MIHGGGAQYNSANRWFDKTVQIVVSGDGAWGLCYEHSMAEGMSVLIQIYTYSLYVFVLLRGAYCTINGKFMETR